MAAARRGARGGRGAAARPPPSEHTQLSKTLSYLLRHGAVSEGLSMDAAGYVAVDELLQHRQLRGRLTLDMLKSIVAECPKQRFELSSETDDQTLRIRATQGHSIATVESEQLLRPLTLEDVAQLPMVVHGTSKNLLPIIQREGLSRMERQHVHFATNLPEEQGGVISGMRRSATAFIELDIAKAMADGYRFYLSTNQVVLCPGNEKGFIPPQYFKRVAER